MDEEIFEKKMEDVSGDVNAPSITDLEIRKYSTQESRTGLHSKIDYEINDKNSLSLYALYLQLDELQTRDVIDTTVQINRTGPGTGAIDYTTRSAFRTQKIQNLTLQGKHLLASNLKVDYATLTYFNDYFSWEKVTAPLIDYIQKF